MKVCNRTNCVIKRLHQEEKIMHTQWFFEENLIYPLKAETKESAITQLADLLYKNGCVRDTFNEAILARESEFPTGLPIPEMGVAIPHTDCKHVIKPAIAVGKLETPIVFCSMGGESDEFVSVGLILMLAIPNKDEVMDMLQNLMGIIRDREFIINLRESTNRNDVISILDSKLNSRESNNRKEEKIADKSTPSENVVVQVTHPVGLHARPASLFVQTAKKFDSAITISKDGCSVNAKSIIKLLALVVKRGDVITIKATGKDATQALTELKELVESDFGGIE